MRIAIIDNGVWAGHPEYIHGSEEICIVSKNSDTKCENSGHGTGVYGIIRKACPCAEIINFKICDGEEVEEEDLCECLEEILLNYDVHVINISMGISVCNNISRLQFLCNELYNKGIVVVSAFDNSGSISYPAAFRTVIGVTNSNECRRTDEFAVYNDKVVNIGAKGGIQRVTWANPAYMMISGNSFACAHVTAQVARFMDEGVSGVENILREFRKKAIYNENEEIKVVSDKPEFKIRKAVLFPFNKEMHALIRYESMLDFQIMGVYETKYSSLVGSDTRHI